MNGEEFEEELYRENLYFVYEDKCKELEKELENLKKIEKEHQRINGELREENKKLNDKINSIFSNFEQFINSYKNDNLDNFFIGLRLSEIIEFYNDLKEVIKSE